MTVTTEFAKCAVGFSREHSSAATRLAVEAITDTFACMIAGARDRATEYLHRALPVLGDGARDDGAWVIGRQRRAPAALAALVNGTCAHMHDLDDTFLPALTHPSSVLTAALVALGQERRCSGSQLVDAYIVGLEMQVYLGRATMRSHGDIGFHPTSTLGCIGAAVACARLLGFDAQRTAHALSLSVSMAGGLKGQTGTMAKPLNAGLGAQHAVQAALLAESGFEGNMEILEGVFGFLEAFGGPTPAGWEAVLPDLGKFPLAIEGVGLMVKRFPCCASIHRLLDCLLELCAEQGVSADNVESITATIPFGSYRNLMFPNPQSDVEARFSMQYTMAAALIGGTLGLPDFTPAAVQRPDVRSLFPRISLEHFPPDPNGAAAEKTPPHQLHVVLKDGRSFHKTRSHAKGTVEFPFTEADRRQKFVDCCAPVVGRDKVAGLYAALGGLCSMKDLTTLGDVVFSPVAEAMANRAGDADTAPVHLETGVL